VVLDGGGIAAVILPVDFEVPTEIAAKIATGTLKLFGGVVRDLNGQIVMHLKEAGPPEAEEVAEKAVAVAKKLTDKLDLTDPKFVVGAVIVGAATICGILYFVTRKPKQPAKPQVPEVPEWVKEYNASLTEYLRAIQEATLTVVAIDRLIAALDVLEAQEGDDRVVLDLSKDEAAQLLNLVVRYTDELAKANSVDLDEPEEQPGSEGASIFDLRRYLEIQKKIFRDAA
jgi:hypothetical protein